MYKEKKIVYINDTDQYFTKNKVYVILDTFIDNDVEIIVIKDDNKSIHKYSEHIINSNFLTISEIRDAKLDLILNSL